MTTLPSVTTEGGKIELTLYADTTHLPATEDSDCEHYAATEEKLVAYLAALPAEIAQRMIATLCNASQNHVDMVDAACDAEAERLFAMTDEELYADIAAHGGDVERIKRWSAATARWARLICDEKARSRELQSELDKERGARESAERDGMLKAYEHVADNLTLGKFMLRLGGIGERACMIARDIVYECRELVLRPTPSPEASDEKVTS